MYSAMAISVKNSAHFAAFAVCCRRGCVVAVAEFADAFGLAEFVLAEAFGVAAAILAVGSPYVDDATACAQSKAAVSAAGG